MGEEGAGSSAGVAGGDGVCGLGWELCLPMDALGSCPAAQLPVLQVQAMQLNHSGLGPSGFDLPSFLCGIQMSLVPWQELEASRM